MIFGTNLSTLNIGLMMYGKVRWQEAEATRKDFNIVLIRQDKKFLTSELSKVIQDAIPLILHCKTMYLFRTISSSTFIILDVQSICITNSGLILGGQNSVSDRQTVFFTAVNPTHKNHQDQIELDLTKPRLASYKQKWTVHKDTVYGVDIQLAQRKGLKFYQTRSNAIILYFTLPAYCISKLIVMKSEEIIYQNLYVSPRSPPKISYKDNLMCDLDSEVAGSSKDTQRIQPKTKTHLSSTVRSVWGQESTKEIEKCTVFHHEGVKHSTRTVRPVGGLKTIQVACRSLNSCST